MKLYCEKENYKLYHGSMLDMLEVIDKNSVDCIVTDPPYELNFMGKGWDNAGVSFNKETWKKCFDVLKPGGHLLAFGGSRTFHRIAVAIEDAGFEIRDTIMWLYGSGFPKSMNIGLEIDKKNGVESKVVGIGKSGSSDTHKRTMISETKDGKSVFGGEYEIKQAQNKWQGWGTQLKPSFEPIIVARKPVERTIVDNVMKYGVGGINIDECRVEPTGEDIGRNNHVKPYGGITINESSTPPVNSTGRYYGRFPANTILTYDDTDFDEVCGGFPDTTGGNRVNTTAVRQSAKNSGYGFDVNTRSEYADSGSASRYFYCAKASKKDRDEGLDTFEDKKFFSTLNTKNGSGEHLDGAQTPVRKNIHPTVKPTELMQYLVRLIAPKNATILDPFMGSGSTGKAVMYENKERDKNYKFIGIELTEEYLPIAEARINYVMN